MSRIFFALLVVFTLISPSVIAQEVAEDGAALTTAKTPAVAACYTPVVKRCCSAAGATLEVPCEIDGIEWTCTTTPAVNDLFATTTTATKGWQQSRTTGNTVTCEYAKVSCGFSAGACNYETTNTTLTCAEKTTHGGLCDQVVTGTTRAGCWN